MTPELLAIGLLALLAVLNMFLLLRQSRDGSATRDALAVAQRMLETGQRSEARELRDTLANTERALAGRAETARIEAQALLGSLTERLVRDQGEQRTLIEAKLRETGNQVGHLTERLARDQGEQRTMIEAKLREMGEHSALRLAAIQASVNEQLAKSIETQMHGSFQRVVDQFAQVQKAMVDVQAVTAQIGDLKRVFTNVKSRGGWGEAQLRAILQDILPDHAWEANRKLRIDSDEIVEFVLVMPAKGHPRPLLALDAKFPSEDYDRLLLASEAGDAEAERAARRALETRLKAEARKIGSKYIVPPVTVDYAIMYLPTDSLYVEAARIPGLIETLGREHRVLVMGPALLPALLRTIQLGAMSLTIAENAKEIERTLGAVRGEFRRIDEVLQKLEKQTGTVNKTITATRARTRAMDRQLSKVEVLAAEEAEAVLQLEAAIEDEGEN